MGCTRTIAILIKIVRKDIMLQRWKFQSYTRVLFCFASSLRSSQESASGVVLLLKCSVLVISFSKRDLFVPKSFENIREGLV